MKASLKARTLKLEATFKAKNSEPMLPKFFYVWTHITDVEQFEQDAHAKCKAMKPERYPIFVRFVGPSDSGTEYGTGPFQEDEEEDDNSPWA